MVEGPGGTVGWHATKEAVWNADGAIMPAEERTRRQAISGKRGETETEATETILVGIYLAIQTMEDEELTVAAGDQVQRCI